MDRRLASQNASSPIACGSLGELAAQSPSSSRLSKRIGAAKKMKIYPLGGRMRPADWGLSDA
jgi:hypothetical protein